MPAKRSCGLHQLRTRRFIACRAILPAPCSARRLLPAAPAERLWPARTPLSLRKYSALLTGSRSVRKASLSTAVISSRLLLFVGSCPAETVRMPLPAALVEALLEIVRIERRASAQARALRKTSSRAHHAENDVPQPQLFLAFGFSNTKPDCISESFQSSVMPSRKTMLFGIDEDLDVVEIEERCRSAAASDRT